MWRVLLLSMMPVPVLADSLIATRTLRPQSTLTAEDVTMVEMEIEGAVSDPNQAIGLETRVAIYAGRPIRLGDLGPSVIIERNQLVTLAYRAAGLSILTEGRALARGGVGESIEVMNLASRSKVTGQIGSDGIVRVFPAS